MKMLITQEEINKAKSITNTFDSQKIYDKLSSENNWLGWLGEYKFSQLLTSKGITYEWNEFVKADYTKPDFIVNGKSLDVKTTYTDALWIQKSEWDYYILSIIERDLSSICFCGWLDNQTIEKCLKTDKYKVTRGNRYDYAIPYEKTRILNELWGLL